MNWSDIEILAELLVVVVVLIDLSGFMDEAKERLRRWLGVKGTISLKPFDCSFCMYHWTALIVMLCLGRLSLAVYTAICVGCLLTSIVRGLLVALLDLFGRMLIWK